MIKRLRVTVDGKPYDVVVELPDESPGVPAAPPIAAPTPPLPAPVAPLQAAPSASTGGPGDVVSPLAGRVAAIVVTVGQPVKEGDHLLTLEAMKMNTFVFAPKAGKVAAIKVAVGDAVAENQPLVQVA